MGKLRTYRHDGTLVSEDDLTLNGLARTIGSMIRCHLSDGSVATGFSDPLRMHDDTTHNFKVENYIYLWTWTNLDEEKHMLIGDGDTKYDQTYEKVMLDQIVDVDLILFSRSGWGGLLTNKFPF